MSKESAFEVGRLYQPIKAIADTLSASQKDVFVRLPGLLAYWPMGIRDLGGVVIEHGGAGNWLVQTGICPTGYDGNAFVHLGNGTNFLNAGAAFGVTGLETFISSSLRGLTIGGWFMIDSTPVVNGGMISKDKLSPDRGYTLVYQAAGVISFLVSGNGASTVGVSSAAVSLATWHFVAARFAPSAEIAIIVDGNKDVNTSVIPASLNISAQAFEVGRQFDDNSQVLHGKVRDVFICAAALSDALIEEVRVTSMP